MGTNYVQGRNDGVSRVSNAYGPTTNQRRKFTLDIFEKFTKSRKIKNFGRFAYGPTRPSLRLWQCSYKYFYDIFIRLPQIGAAKFIVLGSRIVSFGQQLHYFFGQLNYLFWTANLFFWAARLIIWAAIFIEKPAKFINGQQLFSLLNFR